MGDRVETKTVTCRYAIGARGVSFIQIVNERRHFVLHILRHGLPQHHRTFRDRFRTPDFHQVVHIDQACIHRFAQRTRIIAVFPVALPISPGHAGIYITVIDGNDRLFVSAGKLDFTKIFAGLHGDFVRYPGISIDGIK